MKRYLPIILLMIILITSSLTACNQTEKKTDQPAEATQSVGQPAESYPSPEELKGAYPEPQGDATAVDWPVGKQYILNGEIWKVIIASSLEVKLYSKDGNLYTTTAPNAAEVDATVKQCGNWCAGMVYTK